MSNLSSKTVTTDLLIEPINAATGTPISFFVSFSWYSKFAWSKISTSTSCVVQYIFWVSKYLVNCDKAAWRQICFKIFELHITDNHAPQLHEDVFRFKRDRILLEIWSSASLSKSGDNSTSNLKLFIFSISPLSHVPLNDQKQNLQFFIFYFFDFSTRTCHLTTKNHFPKKKKNSFRFFDAINPQKTCDFFGGYHVEKTEKPKNVLFFFWKMVFGR